MLNVLLPCATVSVLGDVSALISTINIRSAGGSSVASATMVYLLAIFISLATAFGVKFLGAILRSFKGSEIE